MGLRTKTHNHGKGQCDRCGFIFKLKHLRQEWTHAKVCGTCFDPTPSQLFPHALVSETEALTDPRPRNNTTASAGNALGKYQIIGRSWAGTDLRITGSGVTAS